MILASDDETYKKKFNVDDQLGIRVDIPSIIIQKSSADLFRQYLSQPIHDKIIISVKFTGEKENGFVELDMFFRSDDIKALHFFTEFQTYYEKLSTSSFLHSRI